jgi:predicted Zn-dependent peptidase
MSASESATLTIWVTAGSRQETPQIQGLAHFLEHMAFKGGRKYPSARAISEKVDGIGGEFNAGTNKDWTNFYIKARSAKLEVAFDILSDMLLTPLLKEEEIEREKGVILEEMAMYEDTPMIKIGDVFERLIFAGNSLADDVIGKEETVKSLKKQDFVDFRAAHYFAPNMLVSVAGGVKEKDVLALTKKYLVDLPAGKRTETTEFKAHQEAPKVSLSQKKAEQAHLILGFQGHGRGYKGRFAESLLSVILGSGMSSRLWLAVRERRGLAYAVRTSMERYGTDAGYLGTYAGVDPKKAQEATKVILEQIYGLKKGKYPITRVELLKAKEYIKGHLALSLEDTRAVNEFFADQALFLPKIQTPETIFKIIDEITIDEIMAEAQKLLIPQGLNLAIIGPYNSPEKFEKLVK